MPPGPPSATGAAGPTSATGTAPGAAGAVNLTKDPGAAEAGGGVVGATEDTSVFSRENWRSGWGTGWGANWGAEDSAARPTWVGEGRQWITEARAASRERRRRAFPIRIGAIGALVVTLGIIGAVDAAVGVALPVYFWVTFGIVVLALLLGMALRRTPWSLTLLLVPAVVGLIAFGNTGAQLHDGFGARDWTPTAESQLRPDYRLAFGQAVLDLRHLGQLSAGHQVTITVASGQVRIIALPTENVTVEADVHAGDVEVDGAQATDTGGYNVSRTVLPPTTAAGAPVTVHVRLADGQISVEHLN
jgi:hypothetical protein